MDSNIYFKKFGNRGPYLIILHGLFGSSDNWQTGAKLLSEAYQVITVDLRNHGRSFHHEDFSFPTLADDLYDLWGEEVLEPCYWVGHSLGGKVVMQLAHLYPEIVRKMVVIDIVNRQYHRRHDPHFDGMKSLHLDTLESRSEADRLLRDSIPDMRTRQFIVKNLQKENGGGYSWKFNLSSIYDHYDNILSPILFDYVYTPTLFVRGALSDYIQEEDIEGLYRSFPAGEVITIEEAGHWVHADQLDRLILEIKNFLN